MMTTVAPDEIFTRGYDWLFNSYVTRQQENAPMLKWAESLGAKSVACLLGTDDDSRSLMDYFIEEGEKMGIEIYPEWINPADNDLRQTSRPPEAMIQMPILSYLLMSPCPRSCAR